MSRRPMHTRTSRLGAALVALTTLAALGLLPAAAPAQGAQGAGTADTNTTSYDVGGLHVIQRRVTANDVVAANVYLLGGTRQLTPADAGVEAMLLEASEHGTRKYPKELLRRRMAELGSLIVIEPSADWTLYGLRCTAAAFDSSWTIFADRLMAPRLDSIEVEQVKDVYQTAVRQRRDSPDALLDYLSDSVTFAGFPYALSPAGTERSIASITPSALRQYEQSQMVLSRMLLVVVGNVDRTRVQRLVSATLAQLPRGAYRWTIPAPPQPHGGALAVVSRQLPTNYIQGYFEGPSAGDARDYTALRVATAVLSGRLFGEIRSRRNLTYAVNAPFLERAVSAGGLYVTTVYPDTTLALMRAEVETLKRELVDPQGLERLVQQFITEYFLGNETNSDQANFLARAQLYRGDWRTGARFVDDLRRVTPEDVRRVAQQYMRNLSWAYIGDPARLSRTATAGF